MRAAGRVVSRDEITTILYQRPSSPFERSLDVHISHIRKKIEEDRVP
jgi:two-component system response regulator CpxR